jgi:hypothetical protein
MILELSVQVMLQSIKLKLKCTKDGTFLYKSIFEDLNTITRIVQYIYHVCVFKAPLGVAFKGTNYVQYDFKVANHKLSTFGANYVYISSVLRNEHGITIIFLRIHTALPLN